jgi:hypothetical protein
VCKTLLIIYNIVDINTPTEDNEDQNLRNSSKFITSGHTSVGTEKTLWVPNIACLGNNVVTVSLLWQRADGVIGKLQLHGAGMRSIHQAICHLNLRLEFPYINQSLRFYEIHSRKFDFADLASGRLMGYFTRFCERRLGHECDKGTETFLRSCVEIFLHINGKNYQSAHGFSFSDGASNPPSPRNEVIYPSSFLLSLLCAISSEA